MTFTAGDEVVTTDNEHQGLLEPLAALQRRHGVQVRVAEALRGGDPLDAIASLIGPRTKVVALSHVLWANGRVLPMRAISDAAHAVGASVLADGAQGAGAIDVDPAALGVDAYAGPGQKWLCGPNGVGFLWLADGFEDASRSPRRATTRATSAAEGQPFWPGARRHDGASLTTAALAGLAAAVTFRRELVGWSEGAAQMADVRARCVAQLAGVPASRCRPRARALPRWSRSRWRGDRPRMSSRRSRRAACWPARCRVSTGCVSRSATGSPTATSSAWQMSCARSRQMSPGDFTLEATDGAARAGAPDDGPRRRRDAGLHARRHAGDRQGRRPARARAARRADHPRQHLPPALPARARSSSRSSAGCTGSWAGTRRSSPIPAASRSFPSPIRAASTPTA